MTVDIPGNQRHLIVLTQEEIRVLRGVCAGFSNKEIAYSTHQKESMVKKRLYELMGFLQIHNRVELAIWCLRHPESLRSACEQVQVDLAPHPRGCTCDSIYCTAMRLAGEDDDVAA